MRVVALLVLTAVALALSAGSAVAGGHPCGTVRAHYREHGTTQYVEASGIRARGLACRWARQLARRWSHYSRLSGYPDGDELGFRCRYHRVGSDVGRVGCRRGRSHVTWGAYDSSPYH